jgi:hypothetical protein
MHLFVSSKKLNHTYSQSSFPLLTEQERCLYRLPAFSFNFQCIAVAKEINGAVTMWTAVLPTLLLWQTDVCIMSG